MLVLVIGDFFIPEREMDLPHKFKKLLVPGKINVILSTGNCSKRTFEYLEQVCPTVISIRGQIDSTRTKDRCVVEYENFKIGLVENSFIDKHDVQHKEYLARQMNVDILVSGGTHRFEAYEHHDRFYIDPGSATGAFTLESDDIVPSFVLMDLNTSGFSLYIYKLIDDQVKVEKMDYSRPTVVQ
jgi:vacuolar protein sorting-associated protein 29